MTEKSLKELVDDFAKRKLEIMLRQRGKKKFYVVGSNVDVFGDGVAHQCSRCGSPVILRPFISKAVKQYGLKIFCVPCVPEEKLLDQLSEDAKQIKAKIIIENREEFVV